MGELDVISFRLTCELQSALHVTRCAVAEALDEPYLARVEVTVDEADPDLALVLGGDAVLELSRGSALRRFCGVVRAATSRQGDDVASERTGLSLEIVPGLWMLSLRTNTKMFQGKTVPEILEAVLSDGLGGYGRTVQNELTGTYPTREYCLQYQETDLQFVHRLMQEEGIAYCFDHSGEVEALILRDSNKSYPQAEGGASVPFQPHNHVIVDAEPIHFFEHGHHATTTSVALRDFDWTKGGYVVEDKAEAQDAAGRSRESYEHGEGRSLTIWDYSGTAYGQNDAAGQKKIRQESHLARVLVGRGHGRVLGFTPGTTFTLAGHTGGLDGEYLIIRVHHASMALGAHNDAEPYHNRFECIPIDVTHRPVRRAAKPRIASIQTAVVTGPSGEEIHTDEHGRIKVQFHWDRDNPADDTSSCWVRVQQKWAGSGWGFWWLPRIGMEVIVQFIDGDPDRPLVTGSVYNGSNATPYALPDDKTKSTIKSNSSPGGGGSNEFRYEDKAGSEEIYTHAQKDYNEVVENDHTTLVHNDQTNTVDVDQTQTIHANQTERVDGNSDMTVGGNRTVAVTGNFDEKVDGTETRKVTGAVDETFGADETRTVGANLTEDVGAGETRTVGGSQTETIVGNKEMTVSAASSVTISGALTETITGGVTLTSGGPWTAKDASGYTAVIGGAFTLLSPGGLKVGAPGGITFIDSECSTFCSFMKTDGGIQRALTGVKREAYGAFITMVPFTKGAGISEMMLGPQLMTKASIFQTALNKLCPGAIKAGAGPSSDE